jgi:hypothetical protein
MKQMASGIARVKLSTYMVPSRPRTLRKTTVALTGTLTGINACCANGDQGNITGFKLPGFAGTWRSGFEINEEHYYGLATLTQDSASSEGSFGIFGTVQDSAQSGQPHESCLSGTITSGTFPSASFIIGSSVSLAIQTNDGTIVFSGTMNQDGSEIIGIHRIVGGTCNGFFGAACLGRDFHALCQLP